MIDIAGYYKIDVFAQKIKLQKNETYICSKNYGNQPLHFVSFGTFQFFMTMSFFAWDIWHKCKGFLIKFGSWPKSWIWKFETKLQKDDSYSQLQQGPSKLELAVATLLCYMWFQYLDEKTITRRIRNKLIIVHV